MHARQFSLTSAVRKNDIDQLAFLGPEMLPTTPVRRQYLDLKARYPDAILFFRLGDFYETFDRDAQIVSRALDIVLTGRDIGRGERMPMAGVPYHAAEGYIARLIEQGHRVAICEQIGEVPLKGLVKREVVRVITPGHAGRRGAAAGPREQLPGRRPDRACWRRAGLG